VHRGNNRCEIFRGDADYLFFRHCLLERRRFGIALHSYVLMSNHVHLLATPLEPDAISRFVQSIARRYVGYFNSRYQRSGTLWEGRFHAAVIHSDHYLLACHRYIDMNPVRAGMVHRPEDYAWSSHRHYLRGDTDSIVDPHAGVEGLGADPLARRLAYGHLFEGPENPFELMRLREDVQACRPMFDAPVRGARMGRPAKSRL